MTRYIVVVFVVIVLVVVVVVAVVTVVVVAVVTVVFVAVVVMIYDSHNRHCYSLSTYVAITRTALCTCTYVLGNPTLLSCLPCMTMRGTAGMHG